MVRIIFGLCLWACMIMIMNVSELVVLLVPRFDTRCKRNRVVRDDDASVCILGLTGTDGMKNKIVNLLGFF